MLIAYHNDPKVKADILAQLQAHYDADEIVKGQYWENGKGCAVGCTIYSRDHAKYEPMFGIPVMLAQLEDAIFEGLEATAAKEWPLRFMRAIEPGRDLSLVGWAFQHWLLTDDNVTPGIHHPLVKHAVRQCADVLAVLKDGGRGRAAAESAARSAWNAAESAWGAAESATESAAASAASAAESAWNAAGSATESATESAWNAAASAASAAESAWNAAGSAARSAWNAAESATWGAAESAVRNAAASAASAAWGAAGAAGSATESATESAWNAAWKRMAESAAWKRMADKLVALIETAPVAPSV